MVISFVSHIFAFHYKLTLPKRVTQTNKMICFNLLKFKVKVIIYSLRSL